MAKNLNEKTPRNKEQQKEYNKKYCEANKDKSKAYSKQYYKANKEKIALKAKEYYKKNMIKCKQCNEILNKNNRCFPHGCEIDCGLCSECC